MNVSTAYDSSDPRGIELGHWTAPSRFRQRHTFALVTSAREIETFAKLIYTPDTNERSFTSFTYTHTPIQQLSVILCALVSVKPCSCHRCRAIARSRHLWSLSPLMPYAVRTATCSRACRMQKLPCNIHKIHVGFRLRSVDILFIIVFVCCVIERVVFVSGWFRGFT